jgi:hypothetical protein
MDRSLLGSVIKDIKSLAADFQSCAFKFASRKLNVVAHKLARSAKSLVCNIFVGVTPELIRDELCNDVFDKKKYSGILSRKNINVVHNWPA